MSRSSGRSGSTERCVRRGRHVCGVDSKACRLRCSSLYQAPAFPCLMVLGSWSLALFLHSHAPNDDLACADSVKRGAMRSALQNLTFASCWHRTLQTNGNTYLFLRMHPLPSRESHEHRQTRTSLTCSCTESLPSRVNTFIEPPSTCPS